jgi:alkylhydroperoxidase family enzyme
MNEPRLKYGQLAPEGLAKMRELEHYLNTGSGLDSSVGESEERIASVAEWRSSQRYTKRERAALAWAEAVTNIQDGHAADAVYDEVREQFSDVETVNLTLVISTINAWNRISIALGRHSGHGSGVKA